MRRAHLFAGLAGFCLIGLFGTAARAAVTFDFVTDNNNGNYNVLPSSTVVVQIFLRETLDSGSTSILGPQDGLFSGLVRTIRSVAPSSPANITASSRDGTNFNDFNDSTVDSGNAGANTGGTRSLGAANGTPIITDSATVRRVSLGTITIQAGVIPLQTTTFNMIDRISTADTLTWTSGTQLDSQIVSRTFNVTVTNVPEPATLSILGLGGMLLLRRVRR